MMRNENYGSENKIHPWTEILSRLKKTARREGKGYPRISSDIFLDRFTALL